MSIKYCIRIAEALTSVLLDEQVIEDARAEHEALLKTKASHDEWLEKTDWVQEAIDTGNLPAKYLGHHRADVMRMEIERLLAEHEVLKKVARLAATLVWDVMEEASNGRWQVLDDNALAELIAAMEELK